MNSSMNTHLSSSLVARKIPRMLAVAAALVALPGVVHAQGKWVGQMTTITIDGKNGGAADITVDPRNEKQSRVKLSIRNSIKEVKLAWDVVSGRCREEGIQIAPQATFQVIQASMDGSGVGTANVPKLESGKNYYVRVFEAGTMGSDAKAYGCATLAEKP